jgi:hypothetical protein
MKTFLFKVAPWYNGIITAYYICGDNYTTMVQLKNGMVPLSINK